MNFDTILSAIDKLTGDKRHNAPTKRTAPTVTLHVSAPLCMPIRGIYDELYAVGIRGKWKDTVDVLYPQSASLTVTHKQSEYASLLLWKLSGQWPEGLRIDGDPHKRKSLAAIQRNGWKMPTPWKDRGKEWTQRGCTKTRR
jgi:hypothetical protein